MIRLLVLAMLAAVVGSAVMFAVTGQLAWRKRAVWLFGWTVVAALALLGWTVFTRLISRVV